MSVTASFYKFSKRKNSTKQPTGSGTDYSVDLKSGTSLLSPTLLLNNSGKPDFNYFSFEGMWYFITDIVSVRNDLWEIYGRVDALATAKTAILNSTQFVSYSSTNGSTWLPDTRVPLLKSTTTSRNTVSMAGLFNDVGFYVLTAVGQEGCIAYAMDKSTLEAVLSSIQTWQTDDMITAYNKLNTFSGGDIDIAMTGMPTGDDSIEALGNCIAENLEHLQYAMTGTLANIQHRLQMAMITVGEAAVDTGFLGNAFSLAPQCIRSCIWVPFFATPFADTGKDLYLGNLPCKQNGTIIHPFTLKGSPYKSSVSINIPWHYNDWRRGICEDVYIYLPMVGMIQLSATSLTNVSTLNIAYSATATDGVVCYEVKAGGNVIGTYSGQCSANYPIGINQQASAGEIAQSIISGVDKTVAAAVHSSISPVSMGATVAAGVWNSATAAYETANVANSTHLTTVGGIGGGAGAGLDLDIQCYTVCHETIIAPSDMQATMGLPTMKPMSLSTLTGYCECSNAHVEGDFPSPILSEIDNFLNSGFYIE